MKLDTLLPHGSRIVVLGDLILDTYMHGTVSRISPEAPVPVLRHLKDTETAGGAANVALNVQSLGGQAHLIGLVGADESGARLAELVSSHGVSVDFAVCEDRPTTMKTRVMATRNQQLLRIDREVSTPVSRDIENALIARIRAALVGADALILSDYAKGCLTDNVIAGALAAAREQGIPSLLDPKRKDFSAYVGATYIKPNLNELAHATDMDCSTDAVAAVAARRLAEQTGSSILLTRSERGMCLYAPDGAEEEALPTAAREVFDVSGAGDTVIATFALMLTGAAAPREAMRVANIAAGVVVSKVGTAMVNRRELQDHLRAAQVAWLVEPPEKDAVRILDRAAASALVLNWKAQGLRVGFTNGCFDLLHPGHTSILRGAAASCDRLVVGLNSDSSVRRLKGPTRPIQSETARAEVMASIGSVDAVVVFEEDTPLELITALLPDVLVKGADYTEDQVVGADVVRRAGGRTALIDLVSGHSTTSLVERSRDPAKDVRKNLKTA